MLLSVLVFLSGGPGDTKAAEKPLKAFLSLWEKEAGLPAGTLVGQYFPQKNPALAYVQNDKPQVFLLPITTFLEYEKQWTLAPIGQVALKGSANEQMYIVVKKDPAPTLAALKGKTIVSSLLADPKFGDLVELEDGTMLSKIGTLEYERSPLAALRKLRVGAAAAVLLDESQWLGLEKLPFSSEMQLLAKSKPVPRPIVAVQKKLDKPTVEQLKKGLLGLSANPDARSTLQQFSVDGLVAADETVIAAARKRVPKK